jgi:hypothetical protein
MMSTLCGNPPPGREITVLKDPYFNKSDGFLLLI